MIIFGVISAIVAKLNRLLDQLNVSSRLKTVADIELECLLLLQ